ncbi:MAG: acyl-CoA dehydrogenase [Bdellovibrionales bacterium]
MNFIKRKVPWDDHPKEYGGLGFSALAHADVIAKISTRSVTAGITVMVPNSLGPAELLIHYGTQKQKDFWLPKLATGEAVPCFGLTEPTAGSDAGAIQSTGVLFKDSDGQLKMRLNWNKRWITLAAISDVIGLAFKLQDPEGLLGGEKELGITCALIPSKTPGVVIGRRHDPLAVPFYNCPTQGKDVVVDAEEAIIGGLANAGKGWKMLMESLGAGRGISLPSQSAGGLKYISRVASNHAMIRKQFGVSIGLFEGVQEPLMRIFAQNYYVDAMRHFTLGAIDNGISPPVVTAMCKYQTTEAYRRGINDAMDVLGGTGISLGPKNLIATGYFASPISITVEGANILTRTLMVFGQGALRAHPYAYKEVAAVEAGDLSAFDRAFWGHIGHITRNLSRSIVLSLSRGRLASSPVGGPVAGCWRRLSWASASFAILADMAMGLMGGSLKFKEKITGRFADILSWMYIGLSVLRRWEYEGRRKEDLPLVNVAMWYVFKEIQLSFDGIFRNFDVPVIGLLFKGPVRWWSRFNRIDWELHDEVGAAAVKIFLQDSEQRDRLTKGIYIPSKESEPFAMQEATFKAVIGADAIGRKVRKAIRKKILPKKPFSQILDEAVEKSVITAEEKNLLKVAEDLRSQAIQVDDFSEEEYRAR